MKIALIFIIAFVFVFVYDYANFPRQFCARIYTLILKKDISPASVRLPKLLDCSFCATTWTSLAYLLFVDWRFAPLCFIAAWSTKYIFSLMSIIDMLLIRFFKYIESLLS